MDRWPPSQWDEFLDRACGGDEGLRRRVRELLDTHQGDDRFLDNAPLEGEPTLEARVQERPGQMIGTYKLLEQIGEGGFGVVFMAEQQAPVRRKVALKVLKPGMDTQQVIARFEAQRQALALMDHPNIARVLDAGATETGRPYFVMELVRGMPIIEFCDQQQLTPRDRLELVVDVCHAVQHAHQKGIIHRNLKPSNVLVTLHDDRPVVKVIDFGMAKPVSAQLTKKTVFTGFHPMIGTPLYMSPEQAALSGLDVDTRSDIYSLGVLLYELLTGVTPFDKERLRQAAFDEICRILREEDPPKPSTRISILGATSSVTSACRPSAAYRFRKFARRTKRVLTAAALVAAALVVGTGVSACQAVRATQAERRARPFLELEKFALLEAVESGNRANVARREAETQHDRALRTEAQALASFQKARQAVDEYPTKVTEDELLAVPGLQRLRQELLDAALHFYEEFARERTEDPDLLAELAAAHYRIATIRGELGQTEAFLVASAEAIRLFEQLRAAGHDTLAVRIGRARAYYQAAYLKLHDLNHPRLVQLPTAGGAYYDPQRIEDLVRLCEEILKDDPDHAEARSLLGSASNVLAIERHGARQFDEAIGYYQQSLQRREALAGEFPDNADYRNALGTTVNNLGVVLRGQGEPQAALTMYQRAAIGRTGAMLEREFRVERVRGRGRARRLLGRVADPPGHGRGDLFTNQSSGRQGDRRNREYGLGRAAPSRTAAGRRIRRRGDGRPGPVRGVDGDARRQVSLRRPS